MVTRASGYSNQEVSGDGSESVVYSFFETDRDCGMTPNPCTQVPPTFSPETMGLER